MARINSFKQVDKYQVLAWRFSPEAEFVNNFEDKKEALETALWAAEGGRRVAVFYVCPGRSPKKIYPDSKKTPLENLFSLRLEVNF